MKPVPIQTTRAGELYVGNSEELLKGPLGSELRGKIQLIFTSPPFPLNEKNSAEICKVKNM